MASLMCRKMAAVGNTPLERATNAAVAHAAAAGQMPSVLCSALPCGPIQELQ